MTPAPGTRLARMAPYLGLLFLAEEAAAQARQALPQWSVVEEWRVPDSAWGDARIDAARAAVVDSQGVIHVLLPLDRRVVSLGRDGRITRTLGRQGGGPGEFQRPSALGLAHGTVWVRDEAQRRITLFDASGAGSIHRQSAGVMPAGPALGPAPPRVTALLAQGRMLLETPLAPVGVDARHAIDSGIVIVRHESTGATDTLTRVFRRKPVRVARLTATGGTMVGPNPFAMNDLVARDAYGQRVVVVSMPSVVPRRGPAHVTVTAWSSTGARLFASPLAFEPRFLGEEEITNHVRRLEDLQRTRGGSASRIELEDGPAAGDPVAPFRQVVVGTDQTVWLRRSVSSGSSDWLVLGPSGQELATVALPPSTSVLLAATDTGAWALDVGRDGEVTLVKYRIDRGNRGDTAAMR